MVEFKEKADKIIKERWGIDVEHYCAMVKKKMVKESSYPLNANSIQLGIINKEGKFITDGQFR